jgi:hypothetical protein
MHYSQHVASKNPGVVWKGLIFGIVRLSLHLFYFCYSSSISSSSSLFVLCRLSLLHTCNFKQIIFVSLFLG